MPKNMIIDGLKDAVRHARTGVSGGSLKVVYVDHPIDVRAIRVKLKITQEEFAARFGFTLSAVRNWEQKRRQPEGPARSLLRLIEAEPAIVERVLRAA